MRRLRRTTAMFANLLLLQLVLVGSDGTCGDHRVSTAHPVAGETTHHSVTGAARLASARAGAMDHDASSCAGAGERSGDREPLPLPHAPGGCPTMAACGSAMLTSVRGTLTLSHVGEQVRAAPSATPHGFTVAPEPPPPRG